MLTHRELDPRFRKTRRDILKEFPNDAHPDLNLIKLEKYVENHRLKIRPYAIIPESRSRELYEIARANKIDNPDGFLYSPSDGLAFYSYFLGLSLIFKPSGRLSPRQFESFIAHEQWHANSKSAWPRIGFRYPAQNRYYGEFLEEGSADLFAANYLEQRFKNMVVAVSPTKKAKKIHLPRKYFHLDSAKNLKYSPSALAAYSLELLQDYSLQLIDALINSRSEKDRGRETARLLNTISPGIYQYFIRSPYTTRAFASRLNFVLKLVDSLEN